MITCPYCGKEVDSVAEFCMYCGKSLKVDEKELAKAREVIQKGLDSKKTDEDLRALKAQFNDLEKKLKAPAEDIRIVAGKSPEDKVAERPDAGFGEGIAGFGNYCKAIFQVSINRGEVDKRLLALEARRKLMEVATDSSGGFLVPTAHMSYIETRALETAVVRPRAFVLPEILGDSVEIPCDDVTTHVGSVYGGVIGYWIAEGAVKTASQPKIGQRKLEAHEIAFRTDVTNKLIKFSSISLGQLLATKLGNALGYFEDVAFLTGTGVNQPFGIQNSGSMLTVAKKVGQANGTIIPENISAMVAHLDPMKGDRAVWVAHPYVIEQLMNMGIAVGTGGQLVWQQDFKVKPAALLAGYPIVRSEKLPAIGTPGDLILCAFEDYYIADFGVMELQVSPHALFEYDKSMWRLTKFVDGQPANNTVLTLRDGVSTVSSFVRIAQR